MAPALRDAARFNAACSRFLVCSSRFRLFFKIKTLMSQSEDIKAAARRALAPIAEDMLEIGRASCRERV